MAKLTKHDKKSIEKSMAVPDKRRTCSRRNGKMECLKELRNY